MRTHRTPYRRLLPSVLLAAVLFIAAGCIRDSVADPAGEGSLTLLFATSDNAEASTRSDGEDTYNENLISRAKLFFFNDQSDVLADDTPATYAVTLTGIGARTTHEQTLKINLDTRSAIFGTGTKSHVIAAVNLPADVTIPDNATPAQIRAAVISADFKPLQQADFAMLGQSVVTFTDAEEKNASGTVNLYRAAAKIRLAADIEATVAVPNPDDPDDPSQSITWRANTDGIRLWLINGVDNAHLDGSPLPLTGPTSRRFFHTSPGGTADLSAAGEDDIRKLTPTSGIADYPYWNDAPLYSYAHAWENTPGEMHRTRLVVLVPWQKEGELSWTNTYYTVPLNVNGGTSTDGTTTEILPNSLAANTYYLVKLHIGMLGSFIPDESVELEPTYEIADWERETLDANIADNRFLVVNQTEWVMNNTADLEIPFLTSHKTTVLRTEMYYWHFDPPLNSALRTADYYTFYNDILDYGDFVKNYGSYSTAVSTGEYAGVPLLRKLTDAQNEKSTDADGEHIWQASIPDEQPVIQFHHDMHLWRELDASGEPLYSNTGRAGQDNRYLRETDHLVRTGTNNTTDLDTMHVSRIDFFITIVHEDLKGDPTTRFQETVHIIQYPGIYIEPSYNEGDPQSNRDLGYVYVNAYDNLNENIPGNYWINVHPLSNKQNNRNPNMYVININQLDANYPSYNIGDPRILTSNINLTDASFKGTVRPDTPWTNSRSNSVGSRPPVQAPSWSNGTEGAQRTIQNYYPTDIATGTGSKANFVAPRIRVASSYGRSNAPLTEEDARIRCAAYQEFGYPAGRWRVPTKSEVEFIALLSTNDRIPVLFTPWGDLINGGYVYAYYMTAQGFGYVNGPYYKGGLNGYFRGEVVLNKAHPYQSDAGFLSAPAPAVRCVYDEWYWNKVDGTPDRMPESQYRTFHWGDKEKDDPQKGSM